MQHDETTIDRFLDGRLAIEQPAHGRHRAGLDAILLAATVPDAAEGRLVDLGAGVGTAGLAAAVRAAGLSVTLAERDGEAARLARANAERLGGGRAEVVEVDLLDGRAREAALGRERFSRAICNPPFWEDGAVRASPSARRAAAHVLAAGGLEAWVRAAAALIEPHGVFGLIFRGDGLGEILTACAGRFGAVAIRPIHPRDDQPAHRLLVTARKGSRAPPTVLPGLVLHGAAGGGWRDAVEAILRGRADLAGALSGSS